MSNPARLQQLTTLADQFPQAQAYAPLFDWIDAQPRPLRLAIDGRCAAGKTTLAGLLQAVYGCAVVHMDDFFLQPHQRTQARLAEVGGNVDYERVLAQVIAPLLQDEQVTFCSYQCKIGGFGAPITLENTDFVVFEGAYSMHHTLRHAYHGAVLCSVMPEEQRVRILQRNGAQMLVRFEQEWIPREEAYLSAQNIPALCDFVFTS